MRFDWYAATCPGAPPMELLEGLRSDLGGTVREGRRRLGYGQAFQVIDKGDEVLCEVLCGSVSGGHMEPHACATGEAAHEFALALRERLPDHRVTRMDAAEDFDEPGAFERITRTMMEVKARTGVKGRWIKPDEPEDGATYYLGSTSSAVSARGYQKGLQVRKKLHPLTRDLVSEHWARLEVQVRPGKGAAKDLAASCTPEQAWGFATWSQELAREALSLDVARLQGLGWKGQTDDDRALDWMLRQYGGLLGRLHRDLGDWQCVGLQIGQRLAEIEAAAKASR